MLLARRNNAMNWLNNWFDDDFFNTDWFPTFKTSATAPAVNVKESDKDYTMEIAVPGLKKEFVRVNVNNNGELSVAIENKTEHKEESDKSDKNAHYLRREFSYSNYEQNYELPDDVDRDKISAHVENGILEINMPKIITSDDEQKNTRRIEVA
jgi:HSP20 family protein